MKSIVRGPRGLGLVVSSIILLSALAVFVGSGLSSGTKTAQAGDLATMMRVLHEMQAPDTEVTAALTDQTSPPQQASSSADYFLDIEGIEGESRDRGHEGEIDIVAFSWGVSNSGSAASGTGARTGKATFEDFQFTLPVSIASPELFIATATGRHIPQAVLTVRRSGAEQQEYMKVTLTDVVITSYSSAAEGGDPTEKVSLSFGKVEFEYRPQNSDGSLGTPVKAGYDLQANKEI